MHVVIVEGPDWANFAPFSLSRPVFSLASGAGTLLDKIVRQLPPTRLSLWVRPEMTQFCKRFVLPNLKVPTSINEPLNDEPALLFSGGWLQLGHVSAPKDQFVMTGGDGQIRCARVRSPGLLPEDAMAQSDRWTSLLKLPQSDAPKECALNFPWELIRANTKSLADDAGEAKSKPSHPSGAYHMINSDQVHLAEGVTPEPGCVLDASKGPILVASGAVLGANSVIQGPCSIGWHSTVMPVATIRPGTSIGPQSKFGGEVSNTIVIGCSNKAHEGFLGDSYLGEWVNLGAGTTTSNLKNTYGEVSVKIGSREMPSGHNFLGSLIGDHTKTAIHTRLMTGTYIGYCCMLAGEGSSPRFVPSFSFCTGRGVEPYRADKAAEVMQRVFARRDRKWSDDDAQMLSYVARAAPSVENA